MPPTTHEQKASPSRTVVKLGTQTVVDQQSGAPSLERLCSIITDIARLKAAGREVILVSSGAVGMGRLALGLKGPLSLAEKQACAAVGQSRLMSLYTTLAEAVGVQVAQILVTPRDFTDREAYLNLRNSCEELLRRGVLPIFNENDVVSVAGLRQNDSRQESFNDNDRLSAVIAAKLSAKELIILTDVDGVFTKNPTLDPTAERIPTLSSLKEIAEVACDGTSLLGRGGMSSKLQAARLCALCGVTTVIAAAARPAPITAAISGEVGTTVRLRTESASRPLKGRERWIGVASGFSGVITVDEHAREALERGHSSLLPVGVLQVEGEFEVGDIVSITDEHGAEFARGVASQRASSLRKLAGKRSGASEGALQSDEKKVVVHRDDLVVFTEDEDVA